MDRASAVDAGSLRGDFLIPVAAAPDCYNYKLSLNKWTTMYWDHGKALVALPNTAFLAWTKR